MGADEYHPLSRRGSNFSTHGSIGYMVIDALDTMYLMGLNEEYQRARTWMAVQHSFDRDENYNTFEVSIIWTKLQRLNSNVDNHSCSWGTVVDISSNQRSSIS